MILISDDEEVDLKDPGASPTFIILDEDNDAEEVFANVSNHRQENAKDCSLLNIIWVRDAGTQTEDFNFLDVHISQEEIHNLLTVVDIHIVIIWYFHVFNIQHFR